MADAPRAMDEALAALQRRRGSPRRGSEGSDPATRTLAALLDPRSYQEWGVDREPDGLSGGWGTIDGRTVLVAIEIAERPVTEAARALAARLASVADRQGVPLVVVLALDRPPLVELAALPDAPLVCVAPGRLDPAAAAWLERVPLAIALHGTPQAALEAPTRETALALVRELLGYLPDRGQVATLRPPISPPVRAEEELSRLVPEAEHQVHDIKAVLVRLLDDGKYLELNARQGRGVVTAFARMGGRPVGLLTRQPKHPEGLDDAAERKAIGFLARCAALGLPLITIEDAPVGAPPAPSLAAALMDHPGPRLALVLRHRDLAPPPLAAGRAELVIAWPTAQLAPAPDLRIEPRESRATLLRGLELARFWGTGPKSASYRPPGPAEDPDSGPLSPRLASRSEG